MNAHTMFVLRLPSRLAGIALASWLIAAAAAPSAQAATIIGNLPQSGDDYTQVSAGTGPGNQNQRAVVFTTGGTTIGVDSVTLRFGDYNTVAGDVAQVGFFLDNGSGTNTGSQVGSFLTAPFSNDDSPNYVSFLPSGSLTLAANTRYWLLVDASAGDFTWRQSGPPITPTGAYANLDFYAQSQDNGGAYTNPFPQSWSFEITGAVPEPSRAMLLCSGLMGVLLRRHRASKAAQQ